MGPERAGDKPLPAQPIARRSLLKGVGAGAVVAGAGGVLSGIALGFHLVERLLGAQVRAAAATAIEAETPEEVPAPS